MILIYGPLVMTVSRLIDHQSRAVYDETNSDYLWTEHVVVCEGIIGRGAQSWTFVEDPKVGRVPQYVGGTGAGLSSLQAIRHAASLPRQPFALFDPPQNLKRGDKAFQVLLYSDGIDCANGPRPLEPLSVKSNHGEGAVIFCTMSFVVCVNDCPKARDNVLVGGNQLVPGQPLIKPQLNLVNFGGVPALLSNRYGMTIEYDRDDESASYRVEGRATFRADVLAKLNIPSLDIFRDAVLPLPRKNCKRYIDRLYYTPDGISIEYAYTEREDARTYNDFPADKNGLPLPPLVGPTQRNVEKVNLYVKKVASSASLDDATQQAISAAQSAEFEGVGGKATGKSALGRFGYFKAISIAKSIADALAPGYLEVAVCEVFGNRASSMRDLQALAYSLAAGALGYGLSNGLVGKDSSLWLPNIQTTLEYSQTAVFVKVTLAVQRSGMTDYVVGDTLPGLRTMVAPIQDDVLGGEMPYSAASLGKLVPTDTRALAARLSNAGMGRANPDTGKLDDFADLKKRLAPLYTAGRENRDQLIITNKDGFVRGPSGDGYSRSSSDILLHVAAKLLGPCEMPGPAVALELPKAPVKAAVPRPAPLPTTNSPPTPYSNYAPGGSQQIGPPKTLPQSAQELIKTWEKETRQLQGGLFDPNAPRR